MCHTEELSTFMDRVHETESSESRLRKSSRCPMEKGTERRDAKRVGEV